METHEAQAQQDRQDPQDRHDRQERNRLIVFGVLLTILLCVLLIPARHLFGSWNADAPGDVSDITAFDVTGADDGGAHALSPFRTSADRLFPLDDVADRTGLEGILVAGFDTTTATPDAIALLASTDLGGAFDDGAFRTGALGTAGFGDGAFGGYSTSGAGFLGGAFFGGGSASGFGGSGSSAGAGQSQSQPRQSRSGHSLRTDYSGDSGSDSGTSGSGDDPIVFVSDPGDQGPAGGGLSVSVYPSGPDGGTILSDPSTDPPAGSGPGGVSVSATDPTPVPEPATLLLLGAGLVVAGHRLNRRRLS